MAYAKLTEKTADNSIANDNWQRDRTWKQLTDKANKAYSASQIPLAEALYRDALEKAEMLFEDESNNDNSIPLPVIYNISCHNLAELCEHQGMTEEAARFYKQAYDRLLSTANEPCAALQLRLSCMQHLKHTLSVLIHFLQRNGASNEHMGKLIQQAHHTAYRVYQIVQHSAHFDQCQKERPALLS